LLLLLLSCSQPEQIPKKEHSTLAILYVQQSAEYRALTYQAYNLAHMRLERELLKRDAIKKAIVLDIDETILDNSDFNASLAISDEEYSSAKWAEWAAKSIADTVPGAFSFLQFADQNGFAIFYVSNRKVSEKAGTIRNLEYFHFPQVSDDHVLLRDQTSSKTPRREKISETYKIVLLIGDNLNDFSDVFEEKTNKDRRMEADHFKAEYGNRFIILPNPFYGEWESALYDYDYKKSPEEKRAIRLSTLKSHTEKK
ncbi:MAG: 5'-nucleotidase, lipoprotein e(P4) family, partial [Calditrichaeota bacterium]|nr:5'-nucleotidase, lipoprotein e(P4) family [Calditrichota bacterium]